MLKKLSTPTLLYFLFSKTIKRRIFSRSMQLNYFLAVSAIKHQLVWNISVVRKLEYLPKSTKNFLKEPTRKILNSSNWIFENWREIYSFKISRRMNFFFMIVKSSNQNLCNSYHQNRSKNHPPKQTANKTTFLIKVLNA